MNALFGNPWAGDGLQNIRIGYCGIEVSFRFIAGKSVTVDSLRYFNAYSLTKPGYHSGNGGWLLIELRSDDGSPNHAPGRVTLATGTVYSPLNVQKQLLVKFDAPAKLEAGKVYHITFRNCDPAPEINHVSINTMMVFKPRDLTKPEQPGLAPLDMQVLARDKYNTHWRLFKPYHTCTPIFSLYCDGKVVVPGYGGMESWVAFPRRIAGPEAVRQIFTPFLDVEVKNVAIRVAKSGNPGPLKAVLRTDVGVAHAWGSVLTASYVDTVLIPPNRLGHGWAVIPFDRPVTLLRGIQYRLEFTAPKGDAYETFPLRDGAEFGYAPVWSNSWAEFTTTGDPGWQGWEAWGTRYLRCGDLQLYFNA